MHHVIENLSSYIEEQVLELLISWILDNIHYRSGDISVTRYFLTMVHGQKGTPGI